MQIRPVLAWAGALLVLGCPSGSQHPVRGLSVASTPPPSSLLRLPVDGGTATLYHLPELGRWTWSATTPLPPVQRIVGVDLDLGLVYLLGRKREIVSFDLQTARPREEALSGATETAIGPDGTLFTVNDSLRVTRYLRRSPATFATPLPGRPRDLYGMRGSSLLAISGGAAAELTVLRQGEETIRAPLPGGAAAVTYWSDLLAIAADSAVILVDPDAPGTPVAIEVTDHARAVVFSPSGHRFYVAQREGPLLVFNRFTRERVTEVELPGAAGALRADQYGRWLLIHPAGADSLWLVDAATNRYVGGFAAEWALDLPTVTNQQTLLLRSGRDVVAYDLTQPGLPKVGVVAGGAHDLWIPLAWTPETGTASAPAVAAQDSTAAGGSADTAGVFLQISSSQNPEWARELAKQLERQALPARVIGPTAGEEGYRVVLGPYPTREVAESAGRRLGRPFFIYQHDR